MYIYTYILCRQINMHAFMHTCIHAYIYNIGVLGAAGQPQRPAGRRADQQGETASEIIVIIIVACSNIINNNTNSNNTSSNTCGPMG